MNIFKTYFAIEKKIKSKGFDVERPELVETFTNGRKKRLSKLNISAYNAFIIWLSNKFNINEDTNWQNTPANKMRRKIWSYLLNKCNILKHQCMYGLKNMVNSKNH